jgi:hypothetical protein
MMRLEWKQYDMTWKLKQYIHGGPMHSNATFRYAGEVYRLPTVKESWVGLHHIKHEHHSFNSKEEAMAWVEVVVRMEGN